MNDIIFFQLKNRERMKQIFNNISFEDTGILINKIEYEEYIKMMFFTDTDFIIKDNKYYTVSHTDNGNKSIYKLIEIDIAESEIGNKFNIA